MSQAWRYDQPGVMRQVVDVGPDRIAVDFHDELNVSECISHDIDLTRNLSWNASSVVEAGLVS